MTRWLDHATWLAVAIIAVELLLCVAVLWFLVTTTGATP